MPSPLLRHLLDSRMHSADAPSRLSLLVAMQLTYPGTRISTLQEVFEFVQCADPARQVLWNIESKIDARYPNRTLGVSDFVQRQYEVFSRSPYKGSITVRTSSDVRCV